MLWSSPGWRGVVTASSIRLFSTIGLLPGSFLSLGPELVENLGEDRSAGQLDEDQIKILVKCSTTGGPEKYGLNSARHCTKRSVARKLSS